ncbi:MAG: hypothetical protein QM689_12580 [Oscillospiraceae bacterium]
MMAAIIKESGESIQKGVNPTAESIRTAIGANRLLSEYISGNMVMFYGADGEINEVATQILKNAGKDNMGVWGDAIMIPFEEGEPYSILVDEAWMEFSSIIRAAREALEAGASE